MEQLSQTAVFAGGCFWCVQSDLGKIPEVIEVVSGYAGAEKEQPPTYENHEGYREAILVTYDREKTTYEELVRHFFRSIDPFDAGGQFADRGFAYTTAIYYGNSEEREIVEKVKREIEEESGKKVATVIEPRAAFYVAEEYHQDYAKKNPVRYALYREGSGRNKYFNNAE